jgi:hypothetical protein
MPVSYHFCGLVFKGVKVSNSQSQNFYREVEKVKQGRKNKALYRSFFDFVVIFFSRWGGGSFKKCQARF